MGPARLGLIQGSLTCVWGASAGMAAVVGAFLYEAVIL